MLGPTIMLIIILITIHRPLLPTRPPRINLDRLRMAQGPIPVRVKTPREVLVLVLEVGVQEEVQEVLEVEGTVDQVLL